MAGHSNNELIKIVTVLRSDYRPEAVEAAEKEIANRDIDTELLKEIKSKAEASHLKTVALEWRKVGAGVRFINFVIDFFAILSLDVLILFLLARVDSTFVNEGNDFFFWLLFAITFLGYYVTLEYKLQKTLGKFLTGTVVVKGDCSHPDLGDIVARTLCRLIPFDRLSFVFFQYGIHDRFSGTMVLKENGKK